MARSSTGAFGKMAEFIRYLASRERLDIDEATVAQPEPSAAGGGFWGWLASSEELGHPDGEASLSPASRRSFFGWLVSRDSLLAGGTGLPEHQAAKGITEEISND